MSSCESRSSGERLQGGYLNSVVYRAGKVHKRYLGFDADARRDLEHATLAQLARHVNVPSATLGSDSATLMLEFAEGVNGQDLIRRGQAEPVLRACGESLRQLQAVEPGPLLDVLSGSGSTIVHGDFGPQNMLLDSAAAVTAILDWEFCHLGAPIEDLAWAEWIVRRHHRDAIGWLPALFDGYGSTPDWTLRKRSMVRSIGSMRTFAVATRRVEDVRLWDERLNDLLTWDENEFLLGDGEATE
jgi:Ser/Thr protein kinase RdoA (MazF antagonist)